MHCNMRLFRRRQLEVVPRQTKTVPPFQIGALERYRECPARRSGLPSGNRKKYRVLERQLLGSIRRPVVRKCCSSGTRYLRFSTWIVRLARNLYSCSSKSSNCAICAMTLIHHERRLYIVVPRAPKRQYCTDNGLIQKTTALLKVTAVATNVLDLEWVRTHPRQSRSSRERFRGW
jgi:hypothetical protein